MPMRGGLVQRGPALGVVSSSGGVAPVAIGDITFALQSPGLNYLIGSYSKNILQSSVDPSIQSRFQSAGYQPGANIVQDYQNNANAGSRVYDIEYGSVQGLYVGVGSNAPFGGTASTTTAVGWSLDGYNWTYSTTTLSSTTCYQVVYGNGVFVISMQSGGLWYSSNGKTWTQVSATSSLNFQSSLAFGNGTFMAMATGGYCWTSTNGSTWAQGTDVAGSAHWIGTANYRSSAYVGSQFVTALTSISGAGYMFSSPDAVTWTSRSISTTYNTLTKLMLVNGTLVAVPSSGVTTYTTDGITWNVLYGGFGAGAPSIFYDPTSNCWYYTTGNRNFYATQNPVSSSSSITSGVIMNAGCYDNVGIKQTLNGVLFVCGVSPSNGTDLTVLNNFTYLPYFYPPAFYIPGGAMGNLFFTTGDYYMRLK